MRLPRLLPTLLLTLAPAAILAATVDIYVSPVTSTSPPTLLAQIVYDAAAPGEAEILAYEPPAFALADDTDDSTVTLAPDTLVRVGVYDTAKGQWTGSTSAAAARNFDAKSYAPTVLLSVDGNGGVVGVAVKGVRIDAGATRDFGPSVLVSVGAKGVRAAPNRPVNLEEVRKGKPEEEKTLLQK